MPDNVENSTTETTDSTVGSTTDSTTETTDSTVGSTTDSTTETTDSTVGSTTDSTTETTDSTVGNTTDSTTETTDSTIGSTTDSTTETTGELPMTPDIMLAKVCAYNELLGIKRFFNVFDYVAIWWEDFKNNSQDERILMFMEAKDLLAKIEGYRSVYFFPNTPQEIKNDLEPKIIQLEEQLDNMIQDALQRWPEFDDVIRLFDRKVRTEALSLKHDVDRKLASSRKEEDSFPMRESE